MTHGRKAQRILKPRKGRIIPKRDHGKNIKKRDPQIPSSANKKKRRLGQIGRKKTGKEKNKERKRPFMAQTAEGPRETRTGKKEWQRMTFKNGRTGFRPNRKERNTPEMRIPRKAYLSTSQRGWPARSFRRNQNQEKERARKKGKKHKKKEKKLSKKNHQKNPSRKKNIKGRTKYCLPISCKRPLLHILGFNGNQTLQVLKAEIAIQDCNF